MQYHEMIKTFQREAGLGSDSEAARALRATLSTLATRLAGGQSSDLTAQLPEELKPAAMPASAGAGEEFPVHEFIRRVARELQVADSQAEREIQTVFATLREAVTPGSDRQPAQPTSAGVRPHGHGHPGERAGRALEDAASGTALIASPGDDETCGRKSYLTLSRPNGRSDGYRSA